ncbi:nicotinate-nucleotide--dimethylbenzimidazole phosphoribosyltransferase [[Clostridium] hylemonae]|uniref:nicotinate-nucleotide--dimethylbenzimidazole phosphoribosyltransferase n=1 Tax=[Clostridium] hylemonae TaxID=89153 RepID=UPI001FCBBBB3|nr:nicotinate-nucleotide--dimethylbenzimidazole phosphoribosyltransferase [[Clostridium] hylemonae]BDF05514.1 nicotinate-nucleotide--dimethylbenzimidazole phosphoribosyltransferase [[Clostridium] hylemonae]
MEQTIQIPDRLTPEYLQNAIEPADRKSMETAGKRWTSVAKPLSSLGKLEDAIVKIAGMKREPLFTLEKKGLVIMCADNGVVEEGVTQTGQEVTAIVADNFTKKAASVALMSEVAGADLFPVDIGMVTDVPSVTDPKQKVAYGTRNMLKEPAMTPKQVWQAVSVGVHMVSRLKALGYDILATGEMGIGNTTTSSAVASVLLQRPVEEVTGKGAGLSSEGLERKISVISRAIRLHGPDRKDVTDVLSKVGGLDIAGLTGVYLGGALLHVPVVVDGFISAVAALCAVRLVPAAADYILASHVSKEPAGKMLLDALHLSPFLTCDMSLGEGSGAVAVLPLLDMGLSVYSRMSTFEEINVEQYERLK